MSRIASGLALASALVAVSLCVPGVASARDCGSFDKKISSDTTYTIEVSTSRVTCRSGTRLMKDFWFRRGRVQHGGPYTYNTYFTLKRWPGWRCYTGAGAGQCNKRGGRRVRYTIPPAE